MWCQRKKGTSDRDASEGGFKGGREEDITTASEGRPSKKAAMDACRNADVSNEHCDTVVEVEVC